MELSRVMPEAERSLRETLRWSTRESHSRLDASFEHVTDPAQTALYDAFVRMNHACHEQLEPILSRSALAPFLTGEGTRLDALRRDMADLGLAPIDLPPFEPAAPTLHEAAGIAYVLEGSRLGSTLIARRLDEAAAAGRGDRPRAYLATSAGPAEFRALMDRLAKLDWNEQTLDDAARGANATFDYFALAARQGGVR